MHARFVPLTGAPEQLSDAWFAQRKGRLTGSKYSNLYFINSEEEYDEYYGIVWEGKPRPPFSEQAKKYMEYGRKHEDIALCAFLDKAPKVVGDLYVAESPFYPHTIPFLGASPDGTYAILWSLCRIGVDGSVSNTDRSVQAPTGHASREGCGFAAAAALWRFGRAASTSPAS